MNLQENIRRIIREETKPGKYLNAVKLIADDYKNEDFICDINVRYYGGFYEVGVKIDKKEFEKKYEKENINYATILMTGYLERLQKTIRQEIKNFLPVDVMVWVNKTNCDKSLNESEGKKGKYITMIEDLTDYFKNEDCVCDIQVEHKPEEFRDSYLITVVLGNKDLDDKFNGISWQISDYRTKLKRKITNGILEFLPIPFYIEFRQTPKCSDYKNLQESEEKKSRLLSNIEENGLYEVISSTGLHINEIEQKVGQLSREVLERFIKDVVKEHFQVIDDDGKTYIIYLEDYPFDVVPIGNSDYIEQLRVIDNKLIFVVALYDEDEYGDQEFSSEELTPSENLSYNYIYEIAGQLGFLLVKGQI